MADTTGKQFAADALKKTGTWAGVAYAIFAALIWLGDLEPSHFGEVEHLLVAAAPILRGVLALLQGNIGDRSKASFAPAADGGDDPAE